MHLYALETCHRGYDTVSLVLCSECDCCQEKLRLNEDVKMISV